jgi:hypothetical protein
MVLRGHRKQNGRQIDSKEKSQLTILDILYPKFPLQNEAGIFR